MRNLLRSVFVTVLLSASYTDMTEAQTMDLAGPWQVRIDPQGEFRPAVNEEEEDADGFQPVLLPGALRDSDLGDPVGPATHWIGNTRPDLLSRPEYQRYQNAGEFKIPFWLQPERHYVGVAYYRRNVQIPESWRGQRILLRLERPHWRTEVWVDRDRVGQDDSLATPHVYDLTGQLDPGHHQLTILVDNSLETIDVGVNSHSVSDHTQSAWHGIVGAIELRAEPKIIIRHMDVLPARDACSARISLLLGNMTRSVFSGSLILRVEQEGQVLGERSMQFRADPGDTGLEYSLTFLREANQWDEFDPQLCQLTAELRSDTSTISEETVTFGIRRIETDGTQFLLNGRPLFLRGTLECCIFPLTGYPPTDVDSWKRIIKVCKAHGLNHIRFHSWCPPEAAFVAADQLGFYYQVECSTWPNQSTSLGDGRPIDQWLYREGQRVLAEYGNHPSFLLLAMGNEPAGPPARGTGYLGPWVEHFKAQTERQLVTSGSGWPSIAENEFHVTPGPRIQQWGQGLQSRINGQPPTTQADYREFVGRYEVPVISHEIGQWCVYPNFEEMKKYTGPLKPRNFEVFRELLREAHMLDQAEDFLMASGRLQVLCYKEEIESALRTPGFGGFQLLDLHDFPGQGTALVGVLDPFWDSKPYMTPAEFRRFCGPTTPLARMAKRTWTSEETFTAEIEVASFGPTPLSATTPVWTIRSGRQVVGSGTLPMRDVAAGQLASLGRIEMPLSAVEAPAKLNLEVVVDQHANDWDFWIYPTQNTDPKPENILLVDRLTDEAVAHLHQGRSVVLFARPEEVDSDVQIGFSSIFWNTAWTGGQAPHTLGVLCDPAHPALAGFVTDGHSDWQWWELVSRSKPMVLDAFSPELRPIVQVVPDWFHPQRLGLVLEASVGKGKLLICSIDLTSDLESRPVARQLRHSLLQYVSSDRFQPSTPVEMAEIRKLFRQPTLLQQLGATVAADSAHRGYAAAQAIDGDPRTIWHTAWEPQPAPMPHTLVLELAETCELAGLRYVPRQDMANGRIANYEIYVSDDGRDWGEPVASGTFPDGTDTQIVRFDAPHMSRYVKLSVLSEVNGRPFASAAEIDILPAK